MMSAHLFPQPSGQTPWRTAILSLVPFAFAGPLAVIHSYHPWWDPQQLPWISSIFVTVAALLLCAGFILGAVKKFPRWSYPYAVYVVILITFLATYLVNGTPWDINHEGYILLWVAVLSVLVTAPLPFFRPFYTNIRRDWTLLSYGLYAFTLFTLIAHDQDVFPRLNLLVLLPSLIGILGALAHLRLSSALSRTAVLILGALASVPLTMFTLYGSWMELLKAAGFVLAVWGVLVGLLLAPILAGIFARSEPFS
jgi:hypothetical protein